MAAFIIAMSALQPDRSIFGEGQVSGVAYNAASQLTNITYYAATETRSYNRLMQLTNITASSSFGSPINVTYNYPTGSNNGKISSTSDALSGETVTYQYDSLNRLISASQWSPITLPLTPVTAQESLFQINPGSPSARSLEMAT